MGAIKEIASGFTKSKSGQTIIKVTIGALLIAVVLFLVKTLFKNIGEKIENFIDSQTIRQLVQQTPTVDGSTMENSFKPQARQIADQCQQAMDFSWGGNWTTDEKTLFSSVIELNGAQLKQVYAEFGERNGADLFQWYREDLGSALVYVTQAEWWGMTQAQLEAHMGERTGNIQERDLMGNIWEKSGLQTNL